MRISRNILGLTVAVLMAHGQFGFAHGGGSMSGGAGTGSMAQPRSSTPEDMAKSAYNSGVRSIKKAQEYESDAVKASTPEKSAKALNKAHEYYSKSLEQFIDAPSRTNPRCIERGTTSNSPTVILAAMTRPGPPTPRRSSSIRPTRKPSNTAKPFSV
jgi:hypothetical protein